MNTTSALSLTSVRVAITALMGQQRKAAEDKSYFGPSPENIESALSELRALRDSLDN
jgi:hypothetical protein